MTLMHSAFKALFNINIVTILSKLHNKSDLHNQRVLFTSEVFNSRALNLVMLLTW